MGYIKSEVLFDGNLKRKGQNMKLQVYMITDEDYTYENQPYNEEYVSGRVTYGLNWKEVEEIWRDLYNDRHDVFPRYKFYTNPDYENGWIYRMGGLLIEDKSNDTIHFVQIWVRHILMAELIAKHISENWDGRLVIPEWETDAHKAWLVDRDEYEELTDEFDLTNIVLCDKNFKFLNRTFSAPAEREAA